MMTEVMKEKHRPKFLEEIFYKFDNLV